MAMREPSKDHSHSAWKAVIALAFIGLIVRVLVAFVSDNIYHPDEVFQVLEQAHRLVFGYGIVPWEYRFGTRSWMPAGFIGLILLGCKALHLDQPQNYIFVVKTILCVMSMSLIFSSYVIAKEVASERAGQMAAFFTCFWYELIYFAHKPLTTTLSAYLLMISLACAVMNSRSRPLLFGAMAALAAAVRIQLLPVVGFIILFVLWKWKKREIFKAGFSFIVVVGFVGLLDYWTWGTPFISYYNDILFNAVYRASYIFGREPFYWYFNALLASSGAAFIIVLLWSLLKPRNLWFILTCAGILLLVHSLVSHKEYRFIFAVIPLLLILMAVLLSEMVPIRIPAGAFIQLYTAGAVSFLALSASGLFHILPYQTVVYPFPPLRREPALTVYKLLADKKNLVGLFDASEGWWNSGGYYYLHQNVPLYFYYHWSNKLIDAAELNRCVSDVIVSAAEKMNPGVKAAAQVGGLEIRTLIDLPASFGTDCPYIPDILQPGVDDKYKPQIRRRW